MGFYLVTLAEDADYAGDYCPYKADKKEDAIQAYIDDCLCGDERLTAKFAVFTLSEPEFYEIESTVTIKEIKKPAKKRAKAS